ncbi:Phosphoribosyltransferase OS=Streptomyces violarus OX=67380 GN=FHS41_003286 PE=4 SV=1 [Streptomyces violarus]
MEKAVNEGVRRQVRDGDGDGDEVRRSGTAGGAEGVWSGSWVAERLGVELVGDDRLTDLLGLALRRNPKRAHLLVSNVLGKHVPQSPSVVYGYGFELGRRVRDLLGADEERRAVVLGYAETATRPRPLRRRRSGPRPVPALHRAAPSSVSPRPAASRRRTRTRPHICSLPEDPALLTGDGPLVLVDDEFSTGNAALTRPRRWPTCPTPASG